MNLFFVHLICHPVEMTPGETPGILLSKILARQSLHTHFTYIELLVFTDWIDILSQVWRFCQVKFKVFVRGSMHVFC